MLKVLAFCSAMLMTPCMSIALQHDDIDADHFAAMGAVPIVVHYRLIRQERNRQSVRSFAFEEVHLQNARKNGKFLTESRSFINGKLHQSRHLRSNETGLIVVNGVHGAPEERSATTATFTKHRTESLATGEYYFLYAGLSNPHMGSDRLFNQYGIKPGEWWLDGSGALRRGEARNRTPTTEDFNGTKCLVFKLSDVESLWLSASDPKVVLRHQLAWEPGVPKIDVSMHKHRVVGGFAFPLEIEWTFYCHASLEPQLKGQVAYRNRLIVDKLSVGETNVSDDLFDEIAIPPGTPILDLDTKAEMSFGNARTGQPNLEMLAELGFVQPKPPSNAMWVVLIVVSIALLACGVMVVYRWRRSKVQ